MKTESFFKNLGDFFDYNPSTSSGLIDVMVTQDKNEKFKTTNFHFRFGKFRILKPKDTEINLYINGIESSFKMRMSKKGIAYFKYFVDRDDNNKIDNYDFTSDFQSEEEKKEENNDLNNDKGFDNKYSFNEEKGFEEDNKNRKKNGLDKNSENIDLDKKKMIDNTELLKTNENIQEKKKKMMMKLKKKIIVKD